LALTLWEAVLLGALQGILEWLPVSSSGQLSLLLSTLLGLPSGEAYRLGIASHLGTALSGAIAVREPVRNALHLGPWLRVMLVPLVAGAPVALAIDKLISGIPGDLLNLLIGVLLLATAATLLKTAGAGGGRSATSLTTRELVLIGVLQGLAALPGLSRSATTIAGLLLLHLDPYEAVKASIAMGTAATGAMALYELAQGVGQPLMVVVSVMVTSLLTGLASAMFMLGLAQKYRKQIIIFIIIISILAIASALPALTK